MSNTEQSTKSTDYLRMLLANSDRAIASAERAIKAARKARNARKRPKGRLVW